MMTVKTHNGGSKEELNPRHINGLQRSWELMNIRGLVLWK